MSPHDNLVAFGSFRREKNTAREAANVFLGPGGERIIDAEGYWNNIDADLFATVQIEGQASFLEVQSV